MADSSRVSPLPFPLLCTPVSTLDALEYKSTVFTHPFLKSINCFHYPRLKFQTPSQGLQGSFELAFAFLPIAQLTPTPASGLSSRVSSSGKSSLMHLSKLPQLSVLPHPSVYRTLCAETLYLQLSEMTHSSLLPSA